MTDLTTPKPLALPLPVLQALRFYARGNHYYLDPEQDDGFDSVSGEPENWLCSEREGDATMFENGGIARRVLLGQPLNWIDGNDDEQPEPVEGEVFVAAPRELADLAPPKNQAEWDRVYSLLRHWSQRAQEAEDALQRLENACDVRAGLLTADAYNAAIEATGMKEALYELDEARRAGRTVLAARP